MEDHWVEGSIAQLVEEVLENHPCMTPRCIWSPVSRLVDQLVGLLSLEMVSRNFH